MKKIVASFTIYLLCFVLTVTPTFSATPPLTPRGTCAEKEVNTALGCISTDITGDFFSNLITISIGLGGGLTLLLILVGVIIITTSSGIPERIKAGQSIITSAITGLLFIICSIYLMNLIGVNILQLPDL
jgi:hypothetical protein